MKDDEGELFLGIYGVEVVQYIYICIYFLLVVDTVCRCEKSHKDLAVIDTHDLICMIHGLVLTTHLEDELSCGYNYT